MEGRGLPDYQSVRRHPGNTVCLADTASYMPADDNARVRLIMNTRRLARCVGAYTLLPGAAFSALPAQMTRFVGMGDRPRLGLYFGLRDLALAATLLGAQRSRTLLLIRGLADASDAAIIVAGLRSGKHSVRVLPLLAGAVGSSILSPVSAARTAPE